MSRLPNAPLLEVIFELRWLMNTQTQWDRYPYLHGDLYNVLRKNYPKRELLAPAETPAELLVNRPVYRFRSEHGYPLFQLGPGLLTVNTIDEEYDWNTYSAQISQILEKLFKTAEFAEGEKVKPTLSYFDFFKVDWEKEDILEYVNENFILSKFQALPETKRKPNKFKYGIGYPIESGSLTIEINTAVNNKKEKGLILQTKIDGTNIPPERSLITEWLDNAHRYTSRLFKQITSGNLYKNFQ